LPDGTYFVKSRGLYNHWVHWSFLCLLENRKRPSKLQQRRRSVLAIT